MKLRYIIGFFAVFFMVVLLLTAGYTISYNYRMERAVSGQEQSADPESVAAEGEAVEDTDSEKDRYYLCELHGFVVVYLDDRKTIYEMTEIRVTDLPEEVQNEIAEGKLIGSEEDLYAFLENYSS